MLGAGDLGLTTHSFRCSGASELPHLGLSMTDIMLFGRWLHECSAREYIRRGEVAVLRARGQLNQQHQCRLRLWNMAASNCWSTFDLLCHGKLLQSHLARVNQESFDLFERRIFDLLQLDRVVGRWGELCQAHLGALAVGAS